MDGYDQLYQAQSHALEEASLVSSKAMAAVYWQAVQMAGCVIVPASQVCAGRPTLLAAHSAPNEVMARRCDLVAMRGQAKDQPARLQVLPFSAW